jgi:putative ABC transport system ATP-binding protein
MDCLIKTENLTREFKTGTKTVTALSGVNLTVDKGQLTIFQGPSGSGKTTMLNILGALDRPTGGTILFEGDDITPWSDERRDRLRRQRMGFIFQSIALIPIMTAWENVEFGLRIAGVKPDERENRTRDCLDRVGLAKRMHHMPQELSGGEQQRVAIARALAHSPGLILADEPTSDLDSKTGIKVIHLFKELIAEKGITIVMTSHNPGIIDMGDRVFTFRDGLVEVTR